MLVFLAIVIVLLVIVVTFTLYPLLRPSAATATDANAEKRDIFRLQFEEIEQDKINGMLDEAQYSIAKNELERRVLDEVGSAAPLVSNSQPDRRLAAILLLLLPLASAALYMVIGNPALIGMPVASPDITAERNMNAQIEPMLASLKAKLEENPEDGTGWALLARSYLELGRHEEAAAAYEKATKIVTDDPQIYADYADALGVINGYNLIGLPEELINKALKLNPDHTKTLMLAATVAFQHQDYKQSIDFWQRLQKNLPADSPNLPDIQAAIDQVYAASGEKPPAVKNIATPEQKQSAVSNAGISGTVSIAPALANKLDPSDSVFIFARPIQGSAMPLAIVRITAKDLPYSYHLDDSSAMMPDHKLSQAGEVVVVARISKAGDATAQAGDFQGKTAVVKAAGEGVNIIVDEIVQ